MSASRLRLNASKIQYIVAWLATQHRQAHRPRCANTDSLTSTVSVVSSARNLGVVDSRLTTADHVALVYHSALSFMTDPTNIRSLSGYAAKAMAQAFISSRLDYCNSVLYGITGSLSQRPQSVQNAAARLITRTGRRDYISLTCSK